ncbi:MAG: hypothetical protein PVF65_03810 [Sphingomonadales bacterium]|jgi:predicted nuclease with TOPRIM domain
MTKVKMEQAGARLQQALQTLESALEDGLSPSADTEKLKDVEARLKAVREERDALVAEKKGLQKRYDDLAQAFETLRAEHNADPSGRLPEVEDLRAAYDELETAYADLQNDLLSGRTAPREKVDLEKVRAVQKEVGDRLNHAIARLEQMVH